MSAPRRGDRPQNVANPEKVGLPARPFLYTLDQLSVLLNVDESRLRSSYVYFQGRSIGVPNRQLLLARNIAPPTLPPDWRVAERELIRWLKTKGYKYYERGSVTH